MQTKKFDIFDSLTASKSGIQKLLKGNYAEIPDDINLSELNNTTVYSLKVKKEIQL